MDQVTRNQLLDEVTEIISQNLGYHTADMYRKYYDGDSSTSIVHSARDILTEIFGPVKAQNLLADITKKYTIT